MTTPSRVDEQARVDEQGDLFVGRQPILDRSLDTIGYELLFRGGARAGTAEFVDGDVAHRTRVDERDHRDRPRHARRLWIALDDFAYSPHLEPLLDLARIVKYDLELTRGDALRQRIELDHAAGRLVVVERIENPADHREAEAAGADYFQGFFFARPSVVVSRAVPTNKMTLLQLLARVNDPTPPSTTSSKSSPPTSPCR